MNAFECVKKELDVLVEQGMPLCGVTVRKNHEKLFEYGVNITNDQRLFLYSCSKPLTIAGVMRLYERGLIGLDDPVSRYLPAYADAFVMKDGAKAKPDTVMTIRHLMTMTAGLNYDLNTEPIRRTIEAGKTDTVSIVNAFVELPLDFSPGAKYQYSLAHDVLAALIEVLTGKKFEVYVKENVFDPLGMTQSDFLIPMEDYERISKQYFFRKGKAELDRRNELRFGSQHASGGAGMVSTVDDQMKFAEALRTYRLLKKETVDMLSKNWLTPRQLESFPQKEKYYYGLGMRTAKPGSARADFGWGGSAGMLLCVDIPHGISLVYSQQMRGFMNMAIRTRIYEALLQDLGYDLQINALTREEIELTY